MKRIMLKSKLHRATVTGADLNYEGSIAIDEDLCKIAEIKEYEKVEIYNINNGERFSTYVIPGKKGEISLNGAAARLVQTDDKIIIASYALFEDSELLNYQPKIILLDSSNNIKNKK